MTVAEIHKSTSCSGVVCSGVWGTLPLDVVRHILLNYLEESKNIISFVSTNRHLYTIIFSDHSFIHGLFKKSFPQSYLEVSPEEQITTADFIRAGLRKKNAQSGNVLFQKHACTGKPGSSVAHDDKLYYVDGPKIKVWEYRTGDERELETSILPKENRLTFLRGFYQTIFSDDAYLLVGNDDSTIIFDRKTEKEIFALAHDAEEYASKTRLIHNNQLFFGFRDGTIHIWDLKEPGKAPKVLQAHPSCITTALTHNHRLYTGARDGTIKIWDLNDMSELRKLTGKRLVPVRKIFVQENSLIADHCLFRQIWDLENGNDPVVVNYSEPLTPHFLHRKSLYCTTRNRVIVQNPAALNSLKVFLTDDEVGLSDVTIHDGLLFGSCSEIKIWKDLPHVDNQSPSSTLSDCPQSFILHKGRLFSSPASGRNFIKIWDFNRPPSRALNLLMQLDIVSQEDFLEKANRKSWFFTEIGIYSDKKLKDVFSEIGIYSNEDLKVLEISSDHAGLEKLCRYLQQYASGLLTAWEKYNLKSIYSLSELKAQPELFQEFSKSFLN